jgi:hypothetical protein
LDGVHHGLFSLRSLAGYEASVWGQGKQTRPTRTSARVLYAL